MKNLKFLSLVCAFLVCATVAASAKNDDKVLLIVDGQRHRRCHCARRAVQICRCRHGRHSCDRQPQVQPDGNGLHRHNELLVRLSEYSDGTVEHSGNQYRCARLYAAGSVFGGLSAAQVSAETLHAGGTLPRRTTTQSSSCRSVSPPNSPNCSIRRQTIFRR